MSTTLADATATWCEETGNEVDSDEAREAVECVAELGDAQAATLVAAGELWAMDRRLDRSLQLDELDTLRLVVRAVADGAITSRDQPDSMDFVNSLLALYGSERDAAKRALALTRASIQSTGRADILESCPTDVRDLEEVRQWCMTTPPGHEWFWVDAVGWVLYRSGN